MKKYQTRTIPFFSVLLSVALLPGLARAYEAIEVSDGGRIEGTVTLAAKDKAVAIPVTQDKKTCGGKKKSPRLKLNKKGQLADAIVRLVDIGKGKALAKSTPVINQHRCEFAPHVQVAGVGSKLTIKNSDGVLHNVHAYLGDSTLFNIAMPMKDQKIKKKLKKPGLVELKCDAGHVWMNAFVWVSEHPYITTTDAKGHFVLDDVPPGTYQLEVWHAGYKLAKPLQAKQHPDYVQPLSKRSAVTVTAGATATVDVKLGS